MWTRGPRSASTGRGPGRYGPLASFVVLVTAAAVVFRDVLLPFVLAGFLVYLADPVVDRIERVSVRGRHLPRWGAVLVMYVGLVATVAVTGVTLIPTLLDEVARFTQTLPGLLKQASDTWLPAASDSLNSLVRRVFGSSTWRPRFDLEAEVRKTLEQSIDVLYAHAGDALVIGQRFVQGVIGGLTATVLTLMVTAFLLIDSRSILGFTRRLVPEEDRGGFDRLIQAVDRGLAGVIRGQLLICLVNGILTWIGLWLLDVPFSLVLALIAGVLSLIPIFGTLLSSIPSILLGLTVSFGTGVLVLGWILLIHALEANLLNPKIMGTAARIHPVVVVFALLAGEHTFGLMGALLAVPIVSMVQSLFLHFSRGVIDGPAEPEAAPGAAGPALAEARAEAPVSGSTG